MRWLTLLLAFILTACAAAAPKAEHVLTYASPYPPTHPFSRADIAWMAHVTRDSGGRIAFRPYWSGSLISSDMSMTELRHGLADIALITPIYARGGAHLLRAQSGFYSGVRTLEDQVKVYDCLAGQFGGFDRELSGLHVLAVQGGNFPGVLTRDRPVRALTDLKGLRLRAQSDAIDVLRALGADPVNMPMGEVYSALAKGVIDGVVAPADTIKSMHFAEVASHFTSIRFSRGAYPARAISVQSFKRLPAELQAILDAARPVWEAALSSEIRKAESAGLALAREKKVSMTAFPHGEQQRFDALYNKFALEQAQALNRFGIDGVPVFREAQQLIADGATSCARPITGHRK
jgi:TRAP-type transport system periplasmic protein